MPFLTLPAELSGDETQAALAGSYGVASAFMATSNWAERWEIMEVCGADGRMFWMGAHLIWGWFIPNSTGASGFALTLLFAFGAMLALSLAAGRLFGSESFWLCLLYVSVSPLFLNYSIRLLGTMPSTMWICLAIYALTGRRDSMKNWLGAGLFLGLAFGTHYGAGPAVVSLAYGWIALLPTDGFRRTGSLKKHLKEFLLGPMLLCASAVIPLLTLQVWAAMAGRSYAERLIRHVNLTALPAWGSHGLWLREMFELDPLLEVGTCVVLIEIVRSSAVTRRAKWTAVAVATSMVGLLIRSMDWDFPRCAVSILLFAAAGIIISLSKVLSHPRLASFPSPEPMNVKAETSADTILTPNRLLMSAAFAFALLTLWRPVSNMPRLTFSVWPIFLLSLIGLLARSPLRLRSGLGRGTALLGIILFLTAASALLQAKTMATRRASFAERHTYMQPLSHNQFRDQSAFEYLFSRASDNVVSFGTSARLYPASLYEEEPYKNGEIRELLKSYSLTRLLDTEDVIDSQVFYESIRQTSADAPPPGTPFVPSFRLKNSPSAKPKSNVPNVAERLARIRVHPYRGIEALLGGGNGEEKFLSMALPAEPGAASRFGFEFLAIAPNSPDGTELRLTIFQGERQIGEVACDLSNVQEREPAPRLFTFPIVPTAPVQEVGVHIRLKVPVGHYCPPVGCYLRRAFIQ